MSGNNDVLYAQFNENDLSTYWGIHDEEGKREGNVDLQEIEIPEGYGIDGIALMRGILRFVKRADQ